MNNVDCRDIARRLIPDRLQSSHGKYDKYFSPFRDDGHKAGLTVYADGVKDHGGNGDYWNPEQFIAALLGTDAAGARQWLGSDTVIERKPRKSEQGPPSPAWQKVAEVFVGDAQRRLWESPAVLDYLRNERGLTDDTIRRAKLGYNPVYSSMRCEGDELHAAPGIVIPWYGEGQLYAVRIRLPVGSLAAVTRHDPSIFGGDKYKSLTGSRQRAGLYNVDAIQRDQPLLIVEGEFDTLIASQALPFAVVTRGSAGDHKNISKKWLVRMKQARPVYLLLDADNAGKQAQESLRNNLGDCISLELPTGKDATEFILNGGNLGKLVSHTRQPEISNSSNNLNQDGIESLDEPIAALDDEPANQQKIIGWFDNSEIPKNWLRWLMHIFNKRSTVLIARDLQRARFNGNLPEVFCIGDFETIYPDRYKRQTISAALDDLKYVRLVGGISVNDSIYPKQRGHKNTNWYTMTSLSAAEAAAFIRPRLEEKYFESLVLPRVDRLLAQIGIDVIERDAVAGVFRQALERQQLDLIEIAKEKLIELAKEGDAARYEQLLQQLNEPTAELAMQELKTLARRANRAEYEKLQQAVVDARSAAYSAERAVDRDMNGWQGWQGWLQALANHEYLSLPENITSLNQLRLEMLRAIVEDNTNHYRADLQHLLAVTDAGLSKLYEQVGIQTRANYEVKSIKFTNLVTLKRSLRQASRDLRGKLVQLRVKIANEGMPDVVPVAEMDEYFSQCGGKMVAVEAEFRVANTLSYKKSSESVEDAAVNDASVVEDDTLDKDGISQVEKPEKRKRARKPRPQFYPMDRYRPEFIFSQMKMVVNLITGHSLIGDADLPIISTSDGQAIEMENLRSVALWMVTQHETMELSNQNSSVSAFNSRYGGRVAS